MKKIVSIFLCIALMGNVAFAQTESKKGTTEIGISYGTMTFPQMVYVMGSVLGITVSLGHFTLENMALYGAPALMAYHYVGDRVAVGGDVAFDIMTADQYNGSDENKEYAGSFNMLATSLMPGVKIDWFDKGKFAMYSKANIGASIYSWADTKPDVLFAAQLSPVCMEFGANSIRGFAEIGFGCRGIVNVGVKKSF